MTDPEQATMGDLFRLMTEMRSDLATVKTDVASVKETVEAHTVTLAEHGAKLDEARAERQAIRDVVDNDLAGQGQVMALEGKMTEVERATRQNGKKIDRLAERMDRAGMPAE